MKNTEDYFYINQTLNGNISSFAFLVDKYQNYVYTIAIRILKNQEDAEELAQDSFIKAYKELNTFKGDSKFSTWIYTITYRLSISKLRTKKIPFLELENKSINNEQINFSQNQINFIETEEQKKYINLALKKLPELDALLLTLYYLHENSVDEICTITNLSESNVKVKLFRARKKIYQELEIILKSEVKSIL